MKRLVLIVLAACGSSPPPSAAHEPAPDLVIPPMPEAGPPPVPVKRAARPEPLGPSYEQALAENSERIQRDPPGLEADMTDGELAAPMRNAAFVAACGAPDSMKVTVKVAVRLGRAAGVSVYTNPPDESVARCVDAHVRSLRWAEKRKMDSFTTTY